MWIIKGLLILELRWSFFFWPKWCQPKLQIIAFKMTYITFVCSHDNLNRSHPIYLMFRCMAHSFQTSVKKNTWKTHWNMWKLIKVVSINHFGSKMAGICDCFNMQTLKKVYSLSRIFEIPKLRYEFGSTWYLMVLCFCFEWKG